MQTKKYFWLKLDRNFFKRHDIQIIESMPNGKDYILFYLKLLVESIDHEGSLRFSETIPYDDKMLSVITNTNIDIVRSAIKLFTELNLMEKLDDATIYLTETKKMLGHETEWAKKKREYRLQLQESNEDNARTKKDNVRQEIELEKEIEIDKELDKEIEKEKKQTKHKYGAYSHVLLSDSEYSSLKNDFPNFQELITYLDEYIEMKGYKAKSHYLAIRKWVADAVKERKPQQKKSFEESVRERAANLS